MNEKLIRLSKESIRELEEIGLGKMIPKNLNFTINYRAKKRLGQCCKKQDINISSWLLEIGDDHDIKNTIIHEILHTFEDTIGHKAKWQYYDNYVNNRTDYHITRLANVDGIYARENKTRPRREVSYKYEITCEKCGKVFYRQKMTKRIFNSFTQGTMIHKSCGGHDFKIVDIKNCEVLW